MPAFEISFERSRDLFALTHLNHSSSLGWNAGLPFRRSSTIDSRPLYQGVVNLAVYVVFTDGVLIS
jgi:hypothetical protein